MNLRRTGLAVILVAAIAAGLWFWSRGRSEKSKTAGPGRVSPDVGMMLRDTSWQTRLGAANSLDTMRGLPVTRRAQLLAEALDREVSAPASGPPFMGSYLPLTSVLRINYLRLLENLGASAAEPVKSALAAATPAGREWRTLALAATGAGESAPELRNLVSSSDPAVRMTAARYLGYLNDKDAIPALRQALADSFTASARTESAEASGGRKRFYPVREQAAQALRTLGLKVQRRGDSYAVE